MQLLSNSSNGGLARARIHMLHFHRILPSFSSFPFNSFSGLVLPVSHEQNPNYQLQKI